MSEPVPPSDALSGVDGTQLPDPLPTLPDPLTGPERGSWLDSPQWQPLELPPLPDVSTLREAIAAVLGDDSGTTTEAVDQQDPAEAPAPQAEPQETEQPHPPQANAPQANAPQANAGQPQVTASIPAGPSQPRGTTGLRNRSPTAAQSRQPGPPADPRSRIRREPAGLPLRMRSDGGAALFFLVMSIIVVVLMYFIINGIMTSISSFFQ